MIADAIRVGDTTIDRVMLGDTEVWSSAPSLPVVQITGTAGNQSRDQFRQACIDHGTTYNTVTDLPFLLDTSQATNMTRMFDLCSALTTVPAMDTSNVTQMISMFSNCSALTTVPAMDTSKSTYMNNMFNNCAALTTVPDMDTNNVIQMSSMFNNCAALTTVPAMDTNNVTSMNIMFNNCAALTTVPDMDTSKATLMSNMFSNCVALTDGNVRLIGKHPSVNTSSMIDGSGLTREPFYDSAGNPI